MERYCKVIPENFCISSLMKLTLILEYVNTKIIYIFFFERYCKIFHFISYEIKPQFGIREYVNTKIIYRFFLFYHVWMLDPTKLNKVSYGILIIDIL